MFSDDSFKKLCTSPSDPNNDKGSPEEDLHEHHWSLENPPILECHGQVTFLKFFSVFTQNATISQHSKQSFLNVGQIFHIWI